MQYQSQTRLSLVPYPFWHIHLQVRRMIGKSRLCRPYSHWYSHQSSSLCRWYHSYGKDSPWSWNQLRILKDFFSNMGMIVNTDKTKVMIIKYLGIIKLWKKWIHTNILELIFTTSSIGIIAFRKGLLGDGKLIMSLKTIVNQLNFGVGIRRNSSLRLFLHMLFFMDVKSRDIVSLVNPREI